MIYLSGRERIFALVYIDGIKVFSVLYYSDISIFVKVLVILEYILWKM
jgi:hypothetical protein